MPVQVYYNNNLIGEPYVSKSYSPIDYGNRWGMTETITLNGYVDPINGVQTQIKQDHNNVNYVEKTTGEVHGITDLFKENFKSFQVKDNNVVLEEYNIASCLVDEISFDKDKWAQGSPVKYTVKLKAYDVFHVDAVTEPENNYSFTENEDGSVNVTHKIGAKGIKTGTLSAFERARVFVDKYAGQNHWGTCDPAFMENRKPVLLSTSENVNRIDGTYSVTENYKYQADAAQCLTCQDGAWQSDANFPTQFNTEAGCRTYYNCAATTQQYLKGEKMTQNLSIADDFHTVDYEIEYQADDTQGIGSLRTLINSETAAGQYTYEKAIASELLGTENNYTKVYQVSMNVSENEPANKISIKGVYQTGAVNLTQGWLDYKIDMARDEVKDTTTYTINGDYVTYGNIESKKKAIKTFKDSYYDNSSNNIESYLYSKLSNSPLFKSYINAPCSNCDRNEWNNDENYPDEFTDEAGCRIYYNCGIRSLSPYPKSIKWSENVNKATVNVTAEFSDEDWLHDVAAPKWNVSVTSSKPTYKEMPAANIDGVFIIQNLNCLTATSTKVSVNGEARHGVAGDKTVLYNPDSVSTETSNDWLAHTQLTDLISSVSNVVAPSDATKYPNEVGGVYNQNKNPSNFNKALTDDNLDSNFPYTFSLSQTYLHTPTTQNWQPLNQANLLAGYWRYVDTRDEGYKFGY